MYVRERVHFKWNELYWYVATYMNIYIIFYTKIHNPFIFSWISLSAARAKTLNDYDFSRIKNYK